MTRHETQLADSYLAEAKVFCSGERDAPQPTIDHVNNLVGKDPEAAWPIVVELVRRAPNDRILAFVAALPLENLLKRHGHLVIERVQQLAKSDSRFRRALTGVWTGWYQGAGWMGELGGCW